MEDLRKRLHDVIPGGAHTYSRGDDQYPSNAPPLLEKGEGAYVWDPSGRRYLDYGMALRAVTLGYGYPPVADAAIAEIRAGNQLTRASVTELRAAELMREIVPSMEMVKFAKNGSTVTTAAVKLARAYTGRKLVAICRDHPFFSYDDWFIGSTPVTRGIPEELRRLTVTFPYNDAASLARLFEEHQGQIAAVMLEPATVLAPCPAACADASLPIPGCAACPHREKSFLSQVQALARRHGAVFILDEMITGFRFDLSGAQKLFGVVPDLTTFGKGMANGFSVAALGGRREIMNLGGILQEGAERVFLISTTHGAEMCGLGAFAKTVEVYRERQVTAHLWRYGRTLVDGMNAIARELGLEPNFQVTGYACSPAFVTRDARGEVSLPLRTLFLQEMVRAGVLMPWMALSLAHGPEELARTLEATRASLVVLRRALADGVERHLVGPVVKPVFRRVN